MVTEKVNLTQLRQRDQQAIKDLYTSYFHAATGLCRSFGATTQDCKDIFQDAVLALFSRLARDENFEVFSLSHYLRGTCYFIWLKTLRSQKRDQATIDAMKRATQTKLFDNSFAEERILDLQECVDLLSEENQNFLSFFYVQRLSDKEISKLLELADGYPKTKRKRLRKNLREKGFLIKNA